MSKHTDNGDCIRCDEIFHRYPGFNVPLWEWFESFQKAHPEAHVSCAGRGRQDQEEAFLRKFSRAHYGQSAHNYNAAIDIFENCGSATDIYERHWFDAILAPNIPTWLEWYGIPGATFSELPHIEVRGWKNLADKGLLKLVE